MWIIPLVGCVPALLALLLINYLVMRAFHRRLNGWLAGWLLVILAELLGLVVISLVGGAQ